MSCADLEILSGEGDKLQTRGGPKIFTIAKTNILGSRGGWTPSLHPPSGSAHVKYQKADYKTMSENFENFRYELYNAEKFKTRGQTV